MKSRIRAILAASILALPGLSGCGTENRGIWSGPGGGPSSGVSGSTNRPGEGVPTPGPGDQNPGTGPAGINTGGSPPPYPK